MKWKVSLLIKEEMLILKMFNILMSNLALDILYGKILMRKDEISVSYPDISYIKKHIKWKPNTNLEKGLKLTIKYYKNK